MAKYKPRYKRVAQLKSVQDFQDYTKELGIDLPFNEAPASGNHSPLSEPHEASGFRIGNRFCILPMEGWDGTTDGLPTDHTRRRWHNFAISGAKLLWGCEAVAVQPDGRANPNQLMINPQSLDHFKDLYQSLVTDHEKAFGDASDLLIGLQLTHSGRFARPDAAGPKPHILYQHPILNGKFGLEPNYPTMPDGAIDQLVEDFVIAARLAREAGFQFVDIKHCHGYLGHEFLTAVDRPGKYGGSLSNRFNFLKAIVEGIQQDSGIPVAVRLSAFDYIPFVAGEDGIGEATNPETGYPYAFGSDLSGTGIQLDDTAEFLNCCEGLGIKLICITAGSPYYVPHIQRPALFPPSDGYLPPEDPLVGVARQIQVTAQLKEMFPNLTIVGSAYSYLQEWLPHVADAVIDSGKADFIGLGRMVLSYPNLPHDILSGAPLKRQHICRTFSDCTTAPRNGMISGCYPLDPYYKRLPEANQLTSIKKLL